MRRVKDYLTNARECRELAARMPAAHRDQLLDMARQWEQIAEERERSIRLGEAAPWEPEQGAD